MRGTCEAPGAWRPGGRRRPRRPRPRDKWAGDAEPSQGKVFLAIGSQRKENSIDIISSREPRFSASSILTHFVLSTTLWFKKTKQKNHMSLPTAFLVNRRDLSATRQIDTLAEFKAFFLFLFFSVMLPTRRTVSFCRNDLYRSRNPCSRR